MGFLPLRSLWLADADQNQGPPRGWAEEQQHAHGLPALRGPCSRPAAAPQGLRDDHCPAGVESKEHGGAWKKSTKQAAMRAGKDRAPSSCPWGSCAWPDRDEGHHAETGHSASHGHEARSRPESRAPQCTHTHTPSCTHASVYAHTHSHTHSPRTQITLTCTHNYSHTHAHARSHTHSPPHSQLLSHSHAHTLTAQAVDVHGEQKAAGHTAPGDCADCWPGRATHPAGCAPGRTPSPAAGQRTAPCPPGLAPP